MTDRSRFIAPILIGIASAAVTAFGLQPCAYAQANEAGMLQVPARSVPVPSTVSPQMAKIISVIFFL